MTTKSFFGISLSNSQERLFWFSRAGRLLFLGYFIYGLLKVLQVFGSGTASFFSILSAIVPEWFEILVWGHSLPVRQDHSVWEFLPLLTMSYMSWWYWLIARLFGVCETGKVFSQETIVLLKRIAYLFLFCALANIILSCCTYLWYYHLSPPSNFSQDLSNSAALGRGIHVTYIGMSPFGLIINGINLEPIAVALMIFIAIGVIDEGRKVREEQELTV